MNKKLKIVFASSFKVYSELGGFFNLRYNISFKDPPLGGFVEILSSVMIFSSGQSPSENIITSGNISPNPPRSGSINDNNSLKEDIYKNYIQSNKNINIDKYKIHKNYFQPSKNTQIQSWLAWPGITEIIHSTPYLHITLKYGFNCITVNCITRCC